MPRHAGTLVRIGGPVLLILLAGMTFASRWLLSTDYLTVLDSLQAAGSISFYDVTNHIPHPPGQPVYIAMLRLLNLVIRSPHHSVLLLVCTADGVAAVLLFWVVSIAISFRAGIVASLLYLLSPLGWLISTLGCTFSLDVCMSAAVGLVVILLIKKPSHKKAVLLGALLALALGIRNNVNLASIALLPLGIYGLLRVRPGGTAKGIAAFAVVFAGWAVPLVMRGGSGGGYLAALTDHWSSAGWSRCALHAVFSSCGPQVAFSILRTDLVAFAYGVFFLMGMASFMAPFAAIPSRYTRSKEESIPRALWFLWILPPILFLAAGNYHGEEYFAVAMPAIVMITSTGLLRVASLMRYALTRLGMPREEDDDRLKRAFIITHVLTICVFNLFGLASLMALQPAEIRTIGNRPVVALGIQMIEGQRDIDLHAAYLRTVTSRCRDHRAALIASNRQDFLQMSLYLPEQVCVLPVGEGGDSLHALLAKDHRIESRKFAKGSQIPLQEEIDLIIAGDESGQIKIKISEELVETALTPRERIALSINGDKRIFMVEPSSVRLYIIENALELSARPAVVPAADSSRAGDYEKGAQQLEAVQ